MSRPDPAASLTMTGDADAAEAVPNGAATAATRPAHSQPARGSVRLLTISFFIGLLAGILTLVPWLITGARLPLQNLWGSEVLPAQMPLALLPLSQYDAVALVGLLTSGGAAAGLALRCWSPKRRGLTVLSAAAGLLLVQVTATAQAFLVVGNGLAPGPRSHLYLAGLLAGVGAAIVASVVALLLLAARARAVAALGMGIMAVPFVFWAESSVADLVGVHNVPLMVPVLWRWLPAVLVGAALAWCGFRPMNRLLVWPLNLAFLWVTPAMFAAIGSSLGTRVYAGDLQAMSEQGAGVFAAALAPGRAVPAVLLALAIALAGSLLREVTARSRSKT